MSNSANVEDALLRPMRAASPEPGAVPLWRVLGPRSSRQGRTHLTPSEVALWIGHERALTAFGKEPRWASKSRLIRVNELGSGNPEDAPR